MNKGKISKLLVSLGLGLLVLFNDTAYFCEK